jgi:hypothetical protein
VQAAADLSAALFLSAANPSDPPVVEIAGHRIGVVRSRDTGDLSSADWVDAFWLCQLANRQAALDALCAIDFGALPATSTRVSPYVQDYREALVAFRRGSADFSDHLVAAAEGADPDSPEVLSADWALYIDTPQLELLTRLVEADADAFNDALARGLESFRTYWKKQRERKRDEDSFVSFPLSALAALARRRGMAVTVESPYLLRDVGTA